MKRIKARYSRTQKRERKRLKEEELTVIDACIASIGSSSNESKQILQQIPNQKKMKTLLKRMIQCMNKSLHTGSVVRDGNITVGDLNKASSVRIITGCDLNESKRQYPSDSTETTLTIRVQPLLVLDLNGILCHRSRVNKEPLDIQLRSSIGTVAHSAIIPRTDLDDFLRYLDQHFCIAIWTSAQRRTARRLLNMLIPIDIRQRILFMWGQNYCQAVRVTSSTSDPDTAKTVFVNDNDKIVVDESNDASESDGGDEIVFQKRLDQVWKAFPLWSADNTLLIDDTRDKCVFAIDNAIHPPSIHGQTLESFQSKVAHGVSQNQLDTRMSDEENQLRQMEFFQSLVGFWTRQPYLHCVQNIHKKAKHSYLAREQMSNSEFYRFLNANVYR
jgi:hypothetical protein